LEKKIIMTGMFFGSLLGGYIPSLFGAGMFSLSSILGTMLGGFFGIWVANKLIS
jgi:hypothetical protein